MLRLMLLPSVSVVQVEVKTMTMLDEQRVSHKFVHKLERALIKLEEKNLPISTDLRRAHVAMVNRARKLFTVPKFDIEDPGNVEK